MVIPGPVEKQPQSYMEPCYTQDHEEATADPSSLRSVGMTALRIEEFIGTRDIFRADPYSTTLRAGSRLRSG